MEDASALNDEVLAKLEKLVLGGTYQPGQRLREQSLATELGVGRGPLREAIRNLEGRRLLQRTPNSGVRVVGLSIDDLEQLLGVREVLEGLAARLAAENITTAEVNSLRAAIHQMETRPKDAARGILTSADSDFHHLIAKGSRNRWLQEMLIKDLYSLLRLHLFQAAQRPDLSETIAEHKVIVDHIHKRDAENAEKAMREHIRRARERILGYARA